MLSKIFLVLGTVILFNFPVLGQNDANNVKGGNEKGPTVYLCCKDKNGKTNPLKDFMYFVPLISPVNVTNEQTPGNSQVGYVTKCSKDTKGNTFTTTCEFRMEGQGTNTNDFDKKGMIDRNVKDVKKGKPLKNILDYIKFNGEGYGRFDVKGEIINGQKVVTSIDVHFNEHGEKSPVYVGLYSVKPKDGQYLYENKFDIKVARVNILSFEKTDGVPKMGIKIDSVGKSEKEMGLFGGVVGSIANLIIQPLEITKIGNDEMLKLGLAVTEDQPTFTFPKAENLINK